MESRLFFMCICITDYINVYEYPNNHILLNRIKKYIPPVL